MKLLFSPERIGTHLSASSLEARTGCVLNAATSLEQLKESFIATSPNSGNMVHSEACAKTFAYTTERSCFGRLPRLRPDLDNLSEACRLVENQFDGLVLSFANRIRPEQQGARFEEIEARANETFDYLTAYIRELRIPIYVFGMGMQDELPPVPDSIPAGLYKMLAAINDRAAVFGVRGELTEKWLHDLGFSKAKALGCPSMFVYPLNMMGVREQRVSESDRILCGGRFRRAEQGSERFKFLKRLSGKFKVSYVFQNDVNAILGMDDFSGAYDSATGRISQKVISEYLDDFIPEARPTFTGCYFFRSTDQWRLFSSIHSAFIGDRFHGGVVALQVRKPALFMQHDQRVRELTGYFDLPTMTISDFLEKDGDQKIDYCFSEEQLGRFREKYRSRLKRYYETCTDAGLRFFNTEAVKKLTH